MLGVKCLATGSTGNSYALDDGETVLLLEAGIQAKKITGGFADWLPRVAGCLITHEHKDHAQGAADLAARGIDLYASHGTFEGIGALHCFYRAHTLQPLKQVTVGSWQVLSFPVEHDAAEPFGYLLYSLRTHEKVLFATDTYFVRYRFSGLTAALVECNYSLSLLVRNVQAGRVPETLKTRLLQSHFSLEHLKEFLSKTDLSRVHDIYLLHCSSQNGNRELFKNEIIQATGIPVTVF